MISRVTSRVTSRDLASLPLTDSASCRKRLNDYTEGLLVQTAQKLDHFKAAFQAARI